MDQQLPILNVLPDFIDAANAHKLVLLEAPPGAGKTTVIPLELLKQPFVGTKKIIMLEPRRIAARNAAVRMAELLGENVGETIGYRVRGESNISATTRIEVVTEGLFIRQIQNDPELEDYAVVLFDEFHERGMLSDLAFGFVKDVQESLNEDIKIVVMSATLGGEEFAAKMPAAKLVKSEGRCFPVETIYCPSDNTKRLEDNAYSILIRAINETTKSILVFLPGIGEINNMLRKMKNSVNDSIVLCALHGGLSLKEQQSAIRPTSDGRRKIVLSTPIAESSLTIDGVSVVIDAGLTRSPKFDPASGMSKLETIRIPRSSADQRRGRAGRLEPGVCYRMWSQIADNSLEEHVVPEVCRGDLAPFLLELACWGIRDCSDFFLLDSPAEKMLESGWELLQSIGAVNYDNSVTQHGRKISGLGVHPRLGHMMINAEKVGKATLACDIAAILEERDFFRDSFSCDISLRIDALLKMKRNEHLASYIDKQLLRKIADQALQWKKKMKVKNEVVDPDDAGRVLAYAYPDRIGKRRGGARNRYQLSNGKGVFIKEEDSLCSSDYVVAASIAVRDKDSKVFLAAHLEEREIYECFSNQIDDDITIYWDKGNECVKALEVQRFGELYLKSKPFRDADPDDYVSAVIDGVKQLGTDALPWTKETVALRGRLQFLHRTFPDDWPDFLDEALIVSLDEWLGPFLRGVTKRSQFKAIPLKDALMSRVGWQLNQKLDTLAPTHYQTPAGPKIRIDYTSGEIPILPVKLQLMFGEHETPRIADGRIPLLIHLLSPARRPVQVTQDLRSFWESTYELVRKEMKGRYPKHDWPAPNEL